MPFTKEELDAMLAADEEIEREFSITPEEIKKSRELDRIAVLDSYSSQKKKIAESKRAYREANREKYNAYMLEYQRKRREKQC